MRLLLTLLTLLNSAQASPGLFELDVMFNKAAREAGVEVRLLRAVCWVETNHRVIDNNNDNGYVSHSICQVQMRAARDVGFKGSPRELKDPMTNMRVAAKYLKSHLEHFKGDWRLAVSAYNGGRKNAVKFNAYIVNVALAIADGR